MLETPDADRRFEETISDKDDTVVQSFAEVEKPDFLYRKINPISRASNHCFRYFIDGSVQTYVVGTGLEHDRNFPIVLAQIGAAALHRLDSGRLVKKIFKQALLLLLPFNSVSENTIKALINIAKETAGNDLQIIDTSQVDVDLGETSASEDFTSRATGIAKSRMRAIERDVATEASQISDDYIVIDGTIRAGSFGWGQSVPKKTVAVSKSFTQRPRFDVFGKEVEMRNLPRLLARLDFENRTPAFFTSKGKVIFWYLRLREQKQVDYPLMGVIKVEIPALNPNDRVIRDHIDLISGCLLAERNVSPYGADGRWHAHLYPIYSTEQYLKTMFYSREVFKGMIKFPVISLS